MTQFSLAYIVSRMFKKSIESIEAHHLDTIFVFKIIFIKMQIDFSY